AMAPGGVPHLPHPHVVMPDRDAVATLEGQAEQAVRGIERGLDDPLELEIRLDRRLVDVAARLAQLLPLVAPVPRRERENFFPPPAPGPAGHRDPPARGGAPAPRRAPAGHARPAAFWPWYRRAGNGRSSDSRAAARARRAAPPSRQ